MSNTDRATGRAGSRRFWGAIFIFAVCNVAAWIGYDRYFAALHRGTLVLSAFEPGEGSDVDTDQSFRWHFSADVIPTSLYHADPAIVSPSIPGKWEWPDPRTLVFTPTSELPLAHDITFTLASNLIHSTTGAPLSGQCVNTVHYARLMLQPPRQVGIAEDDRYLIEFSFNDRVAPGDVLSHLTLTGPDHKTIPCELVGQTAGDVVRIRTGPIVPLVPKDGSKKDADVSVVATISPGLCGLSGPLGVGGPIVTPLALTRQLSATQLDADIPSHGQINLRLQFSGSIDIGTVRQVLSVDPAVPFTLSGDGESSEINIQGDFKPETRYTVRLSNPPAGSDLSRFPRSGLISTFVGDRPVGLWFEHNQGYLSDRGNRTLLAHGINVASVKVSVTKVYDDNLVAWRNSSGRSYRRDINPYAKPIAQRTLRLPGGKNVQQDLRIDLNELLPATADWDGVYQIRLNIPRSASDANNADDDDEDGFGFGAADTAIVTLSDIGLTTKQTRDGLSVWAVSLRSAKPMARVRIRLYSDKNQLLGQATTNADGFATLADVHPPTGEHPAVVLAEQLPPPASMLIGPQLPTTQPIAKNSSGLTWLDLRQSQWELGDTDTSGRSYLRQGYEAFVYAERGVYRPGETVHLRAIVHGSDGLVPTESFPVRWQFWRPDGHRWISKTVSLDADGSASIDMPLPSDIVTGQWTASLGLPGQRQDPDKDFGQTDFGVEEFVPNRLKVQLSLPNDDSSLASSTNQPRQTLRYPIAQPLSAEVQADYLFGRPAAQLPVTTSLMAEPDTFAPEGWNGWTFGPGDGQPQPTPAHHHHKKTGQSRLRAADDSATTAQLDDHGHFTWRIDPADAIGFDPSDIKSPRRDKTDNDPPSEPSFAGPWRLTATASVAEMGGRAVTITRQAQIDALPAYLGARFADGSISPRPGEPVGIELCSVLPSGKMDRENIDTIQCTLSRVSWNTVLEFKQGRYQYNSTRTLDAVKRQTLALDGGYARWNPVPPADGEYLVQFIDTASGANTSFDFFAEDGSPWEDNVDRANPEHVQLSFSTGSDNESKITPHGNPKFAVGQTANLTIASPFAGQLLLTVETDRILSEQVIDMKASHMTVPIPVTQAMRPNAFVSVSVVRAIDPQAKWRNHRAFGVIRLRVNPDDCRLNVAFAAPAEIQPGTTLDVPLHITDHDHQPVPNAAITVAAVDEGICALTDFSTPDPIAYFAADRALGVESGDVFSMLMPEVPRPEKNSAIGGDGGIEATDARHHTPVVARRFVPVALAWQTTHTDADGNTRVSFNVPEFAGTLRLMAVAFVDRRAGEGQSPVLVRSAILAQTSWPRFAAPGDQFSVPIVLFNNTKLAGDASVHLHGSTASQDADLLQFGSEEKSEISLPAIHLEAGGQATVNVPVTVAQAAGVCAVDLSAKLNGQEYHEHIELPVRPASPRLEFGASLMVSADRPATLGPLQPMLPGTQTLNVHITPFPSLGVPKGLDYLDRYPYGCVEQTTSAIFPLLVLGRLSPQLDAAHADPARLKQTIDTGIMHLISMQTADGGLAMWPGENTDWDWGTVYAANFLVEARAAGYDVPDDFYDHTLAFVRRLLNQTTDNADTLETQAYAAYVLSLAGTPPRQALDRLNELTRAPTSQGADLEYIATRSQARLMLACAWMLSGRSDLARQMIPAELPVPRNTRQHDGNLDSPTRDRAVLINTLSMVEPENPALPRLVKELADAGEAGQWASTQETAFSILAIARYLSHQPTYKPYDSIELLQGNQNLVNADSGKPIDWTAPVNDIPAKTSPYTVRLAGSPDARGYATWLQSGVPLSPPADASHGLKIQRQYLNTDGQPISHNIVRSGDLVIVQLTLAASTPQNGLAIEDLLPAGLEIENANLATTAKLPEPSQPQPDAVPTAPADLDIDHLDARDDRMVIIGSMPKAVCQFRYLTRAVTPGVYVLPPVRGEAMYDLNTNAISGAGGQLIVLGNESKSEVFTTLREK